MKKFMLLLLAITAPIHSMMRRTFVSPQVFGCKIDDSRMTPHKKAIISKDPEISLNQIYEEKLIDKIADIFQVDAGTVNKAKIKLSDIFFIESFIEFFAAAQSCNYKELKEKHLKNNIGLGFLKKAYLLAEGKEVVFQGLARIHCSDVDECLRLIKNKIEDIKDIIYAAEAGELNPLEMQENFDN